MKFEENTPECIARIGLHGNPDKWTTVIWAVKRSLASMDVDMNYLLGHLEPESENETPERIFDHIAGLVYEDLEQPEDPDFDIDHIKRAIICCAICGGQILKPGDLEGK